jgi:hypothetical protein
VRSICWRAYHYPSAPWGLPTGRTLAMNRSRPIARVHPAKVNLTSIIFRLGIIIVATITPLVASLAQTNPLVGTWMWSNPASSTSLGSTSRMTYYANGKWFIETANPPLPNGKGGGLTRTVGTYQASGSPTDVTVHVIYGNSFLCPAGYGCAPYPPRYAGTMYYPAGTSKVFHLRFQGRDRIVADDGTISVRVK